jgi:hypothetical protein
MGKVLADVNTLQGTTLPTDIQNVIGQYTTNNDMAMVDGLEGQLSNAQNAAGSIVSFVQSCANNTVNTMVYQDNPLLSNSDLSSSLTEVIRQMIANSQSVQVCTVGSTVTAGGSNLGDGQVVVSVKRADGLVQENAFAENITLRCIADSETNAALAGKEQFKVTGTVSYSPFDWRYVAGGSGGQTTVSAVPGSVDNSSGNLTTNGDFESFTSNTPDNWSILVGSAGTTIKQSTAQHYTGLSSLNIVGNGSELTSVAQVFGDATNGTRGTLASETQYAVNLWVKVDSTPAAGVLEVSLVDGSNTIVNDQQGTANSFTKSLTTVSTTWVAVNGVFRTPYILPSTLKLRVRLSTAMTTGRNLYVDRVAMTRMTQVYTGGPSVAVFSGASNFFVPDNFTAAITNNRGGASNGKTFQCLFNRFFNMSQLGLLLPSSNSPTISDSLIA